MDIKLTGTSLVSFMMAHEGDVLEIRKVSPRKGEIRATTGPMKEALIVFKGKTKIGVIPKKALVKDGTLASKTHCRAKKVDTASSTFIVEL